MLRSGETSGVTPRSAVWLLARRILMRTGEPSSWLRRFGWCSLALMLLGTLGMVGGLQGVLGIVALASFGVGALLAASALLLRVFVPAVAVSTIGIAWGVASLFCVLAVTSGFELELLERLGRVNGHVLVTKYGLDFYEWSEVGEGLQRRPDVRAHSPFVYGTVALQALQPAVHAAGEQGAEAASAEAPQLEARGEPAIVGLKGVDAALLGEFRGVGEMFASGSSDGVRPGEFHTRMPGVVVGRRVARRLGIQVGDQVRLVAPEGANPTLQVQASAPRAATFEVSDLLDTGVSDIDGALVLVDLRAGMSLLHGEGRVTGIELELEDPREATAVALAILDQLNDGRYNALYRSMNSAEGSTPVILIQNIRTIVSVILSLIVLVAGFTLIGALLLIVRQRRKQIAILSAFGATRRTLFAVFEAAGLVAGSAGALAGVLLGATLCAALAWFVWPLDAEVYPLAHLPVSPRAVDALVPAAVAILVCVLVSGPVAWHASRTRPMEALG